MEKLSLHSNHPNTTQDIAAHFEPGTVFEYHVLLIQTKMNCTNNSHIIKCLYGSLSPI